MNTYIKMNLMMAIAFCFSPWITAQEKLTPETLWKFSRISEIQVSPDGKEVVFGMSKYSIEENKGNRDLYIVPISGGQPRRLTDIKGNESNPRWRPDGKKIGFLSSQGGSRQLWEINPDGTGARQVTNIEGGITGFAYAPSMNRILFIREVKIDKSTSDRYPDLKKSDAKIFESLMMRHWDSWEDGNYSHVFVADYTDGKTGEAKDIMPGEAFDSPLTPFGGIEQVALSPDGKTVAYACKKSRGTEYALTTNSDIFLYSVENGTTTNLTEGMMGYDINPVYSPDGKKIAWMSMERNGNESDKERLFVYDFTSKKKEYITEKFDQDVSDLVWDNDNNTLYFTSSHRAMHPVYSVDVNTKKITQLTKSLCSYSELSKAGSKLIAGRSTLSAPVEIYSIDLPSGKEIQVTSENTELLGSLKFGKVEEKNITTTDGKKMQVLMIYPPDFDPSKKYPALLYCQGGPHGMISHQFSYRWNFQLMAANGYIVVAPNRRGLPGFGQEWNDQICGDWGGQNIKDYLSAIDSASALPYVDRNRLGAVGASYGGYSVFFLAGNHNKRFKAFIAHAGVFNLESMYGSTEEIFFANYDVGGPYWDKKNSKIYSEFSPHKHVEKWDTPILITHSEMDLRVPVSEGLQAFTAAQVRGIPSKFVYFPTENHWILSPQNALVWQREFFGWLDKWLKK